MKEQYIQQTCAAIMEQLGGARFRMMTGAKNFGFVHEESTNDVHLIFKIGKNAGGFNTVRIIYRYAPDTYEITFSFVSIKGIRNSKTIEGVYCDQLEELFRDFTGLETRMPKFA